MVRTTVEELTNKETSTHGAQMNMVSLDMETRLTSSKLSHKKSKDYQKIRSRSGVEIISHSSIRIEGMCLDVEQTVMVNLV